LNNAPDQSAAALERQPKTKSAAARRRSQIDRLSELLNIDFDWAENIIAEVEWSVAFSRENAAYWNSPEGREIRRADPERDRTIVEAWGDYGLLSLAGTEDGGDA
jgi:hypothetical protein